MTSSSIPFRMAISLFLRGAGSACNCAKSNTIRLSCCPIPGNPRWFPSSPDIPVRTGYVGEMRYGLLNDARKLNKNRLPLMVERFAQLAEAPLSENSAPVFPSSSAVSETQREQAL